MSDLREQVKLRLPKYKSKKYGEASVLSDESIDELITLIRTATLDEVRPEVERLLTNEIVIANCINLETLNKAIDNLRGDR